MNTDFTCPRCHGLIPNNDQPGAYPGALSRADNKTEVCSACGIDEAIKQFFEGFCEPIHEWPVKQMHHVAEAIQQTLEAER